MIVAIDATVNHSWRVVDAQPEPLHVGVLWIHKSSQTDQPSPKAGRQFCLTDKDGVSKDYLYLVRLVFRREFVFMARRRGLDGRVGIEKRPWLVP